MIIPINRHDSSSRSIHNTYQSPNVQSRSTHRKAEQEEDEAFDQFVGKLTETPAHPTIPEVQDDEVIPPIEQTPDDIKGVSIIQHENEWEEDFNDD